MAVLYGPRATGRLTAHPPVRMRPNLRGYRNTGALRLSMGETLGRIAVLGRGWGGVQGQVPVPAPASGGNGKPPYEPVLGAELRRTSEVRRNLDTCPLPLAAMETRPARLTSPNPSRTLPLPSKVGPAVSARGPHVLPHLTPPAPSPSLSAGGEGRGGLGWRWVRSGSASAKTPKVLQTFGVSVGDILLTQRRKDTRGKGRAGVGIGEVHMRAARRPQRFALKSPRSRRSLR